MERAEEKRKAAFHEFYTRLYRPDVIKRKWKKPVSCSSFHEHRSAFHQYEQLALVDRSLDDEALMDDILRHAMPCLSCTRVPLYPEAKLFRPEHPNYVVSRHALDGWCPQNHMDCAAAAVAGAVSAALGRKRGELDYIETMDVVTAMKRMAERQIADRIATLEKKHPAVNWAVAKKAITKLIRHRPQPKEGDVRFEDFNRRAMNEEVGRLLAKELDALIVLSGDSVMSRVFHLCKLYAIEIMASHHDYPGVVKELGLGLKMTYFDSYSWETLKEMIGQEGNGVVVFVPQHLVMAFATGEDDEGKHRHVLIGRISGGQSPCSWIPWSQGDLIEGETGWVDHITPHGPADMPDPSTYTPSDFLTMSDGGSSMRTIAVVSKAKTTTKPKTSHIPDWLLRDDVCCNSCMVDRAKGDTKRRDQERRAWLGL